MRYMTCIGCKLADTDCPFRRKLRDKIAGLGVTSIRWKCDGRVPAFKPGDAVWARTYSSDPDGYEDREDHFPGHVVDTMQKRVLVFIPDGSVGSDGVSFVARKNGFCLLPYGRVTERDAPAEKICQHCQQPESAGHGPHADDYRGQPGDF